MVCLFRESYKKYYYAPWISFPSCITITAGIVLILLPFFTAFSNQRFWSLMDVFYEHPVVRYNNEYMLEVYYDDDTTETHSSFPSMNKIAPSLAKVMLVEVFKNETNLDDIIDSIQFRMVILKSASVNLMNLKLMLFLDYIIQSKAQMQMQTMCYMNINTPYGASQIVTNGDLVLNQKTPMKVYPYMDMTTAYDYFGPESQSDISPSMADVYAEFTANRNFTTQYDYQARIKPYFADNSIEVIVNIDIPPKQRIIYEMSTAESLKFNWVQYLALFIPLLLIVYYFLSFIYKYRIFHCSVMTDLPKVVN